MIRMVQDLKARAAALLKRLQRCGEEPLAELELQIVFKKIQAVGKLNLAGTASVDALARKTHHGAHNSQARLTAYRMCQRKNGLSNHPNQAIRQLSVGDAPNPRRRVRCKSEWAWRLYGNKEWSAG